MVSRCIATMMAVAVCDITQSPLFFRFVLSRSLSGILENNLFIDLIGLIRSIFRFTLILFRFVLVALGIEIAADNKHQNGLIQRVR